MQKNILFVAQIALGADLDKHARIAVRDGTQMGDAVGAALRRILGRSPHRGGRRIGEAHLGVGDGAQPD